MNPIDRGFVCSVCLSIYAEPVVICNICDSKIAIERPAGAGALKKKKKAGVATGNSGSEASK